MSEKILEFSKPTNKEEGSANKTEQGIVYPPEIKTKLDLAMDKITQVEKGSPEELTALKTYQEKITEAKIEYNNIHQELMNSPEFQDRALDYLQYLLTQRASKDLVTQGLVGLDSERAWQMRQDLLAQGADKGCVAMGVYGNYLMAGVRRARTDKLKNEGRL